MAETQGQSLNRQDINFTQISCDGHGYLITSKSLGGCTLQEFCDAHYRGTDRDRKALVRRGVYLPLLFDGDCMLDDAKVVVGKLTEAEETEWIKVLTWKLNIPCGELAIICEGGEDEEIARAIEDENDPTYHPYELVKVIPGEYLFNLYATRKRFVLHLDTLVEKPEMPSNYADGWFDLPNLYNALGLDDDEDLDFEDEDDEDLDFEDEDDDE